MKSQVEKKQAKQKNGEKNFWYGLRFRKRKTPSQKSRHITEKKIFEKSPTRKINRKRQEMQKKY